MNPGIVGEARTRILVGAIAVLSMGPAQKRDGSHDPTVFGRFVLARPGTAEQPSAASHLANRGRVAWRALVVGGLDHGVTPTPEGSMLVAHRRPLVSERRHNGELVWSAALGGSPAATSPVVLGNGVRLVLTSSGELFSFSRRGEQMGLRTLGFELPSPPALLPAEDGSLYIGSGRHLSRLDASGRITLDAELAQDVAWLLGGTGSILVVSASGVVSRLGSGGEVAQEAAFDQPLLQAIRLDAHHVLGATLSGHLLELDLRAGQQRAIIEDPGLGPVTALVADTISGPRVLTRDAFLLGLDHGRDELFRVLLGKVGDATPSLMVSSNGVTLLALPGSDAILVSNQGQAQPIEKTACAEPLRPAALAGGQGVLACRTGALIGLDPLPLAQ